MTTSVQQRTSAVQRAVRPVLIAELRSFRFSRFLAAECVNNTEMEGAVVRTNLMATGWLLRRFMPVPGLGSANNLDGHHTQRRTFEHNTERALSDLLADSKMGADDAI